jgi:hypothetical protein
MTGQSSGARASTFAHQRIAGAAGIGEVGQRVSPPSSLADWNERAACSCAHVPQSNSHHQQLLQGLLQLLQQHQHQALLPQDRGSCLAKLCEQRRSGLPLEPEVRPKRSRCARLFPAPPVRRAGCFSGSAACTHLLWCHPSVSAWCLPIGCCGSRSLGALGWVMSIERSKAMHGVEMGMLVCYRRFLGDGLARAR